MSDSLDALRERAQGCLLGQLCGDALGSLVEGSSSEEILSEYPLGVCNMAHGGYHRTIAGQITDDSEMALTLAKSILQEKSYNANAVKLAYVSWLKSRPFDCGISVMYALKGVPDPISQSNGALMRVSPLGIFGSQCDLAQVACWAMEDSAITHAHPLCVQINAIFVMALAYAIKTGPTRADVYAKIVEWAKELRVENAIITLITVSADKPPPEYDGDNKGWVMVAFGNALWQLLHAPDFENALINTIMKGGDTDTNAAICGALLGAVLGINAIPARWVNTVINCRPTIEDKKVIRPRPCDYWAIDAIHIANSLLDVETTT